MNCQICNKPLKLAKEEYNQVCENCYLKYKPYLKSAYEFGFKYLKRLIKERKYCEEHKVFYTNYCSVCERQKIKSHYKSKRCQRCGIFINNRSKKYCTKCAMAIAYEKEN